MQLNPLNLLLDCWSRAGQRARAKKASEKAALRRKATEAWLSRLPPLRCINPVKDSFRNVCTQPASSFFRKLPLEIRQLIYMYVWDGEELLFWVPDENEEFNGNEMGREGVEFTLTCLKARRVLAFPMSCKRAYFEAIEYMYKYTIFRFSTVTAYWCFRRRVHSAAFDLIRNLHLQYAYPQAWQHYLFMFHGIPPYNHEAWRKTWGDIGRMKGLCDVRVDVVMKDRYIHAEVEDAFFAPIEGLEDVEVEVRVNWRLDERKPIGEEWPFVLRRHRVYLERRDGLFDLGAEEAETEDQ